MVSRIDRGPVANWWWTVDRWFFAAFLTLMGLGIVLSFAASPAVAERIGLAKALARTDAQGQPVLPGLSVRIAALTAFWLSDDYARLRESIGANDHLTLHLRTTHSPPVEPEERPASTKRTPVPSEVEE